MAAAQHVGVVVLGDVGRSPRMQYHCTSLAALPDTQVHLVGYRGERCIAAVEESPRISQHLLSTPFARAPRSLFLLWAPLKVAHQLLSLLWVLLVVMPRPTAVLVQNPPSIPALAAVWLACRLRGARMVVDWHNFGYTVLGLSLGARHPLVRVSRAYESFFARRADAHLCVTRAMREWLADNWRVTATVLYDRAPPFFRPTTLEERHELFTRLAPQLPPASPPPQGAGRPRRGAAAVASAEPGTFTLFTEVVDGVVRLRADRPALLVSSTSWTEDEDFGVLLEALVALDAAAAEGAPPPSSPSLPSFLVVVTGKGPQRAMYEARMAALRLSRVAVRTMWLAPGDYPRLLGAADLGVCLHFSTSGLDLPMKVVDMFGAGLPVAAVAFSCLSELVVHENNGLVFTGAAQLTAHLRRAFEGFPADPSARELARLRSGVAAFQSVRWQDNWTANAAPLFARAGT